VCKQCRGAGQVRFQQGFFTVARTCGACRGTGRVITKPCTSCRGAGRVGRERKLTVKIPPGIATGQRLRLYGEGESGFARGPAGDLYVVVHVQEHAKFRREGDDLYLDAPVPFPTLVLGGRISIDTPSGAQSLDVPEGTAADTTFRVREKGMPNVAGRGRGDLYVTVKPHVPRKLTREQRKAVEQLREALGGEEASATAAAEEPQKPIFARMKDIFG
jgi:molecular chaperone DnaJ